MITNHSDLDHVLNWLEQNGLPPSTLDYSDFEYRVEYGGYQIVATSGTEWVIRVQAHVSGLYAAMHLQVAPWVMDSVIEYQRKIKEGYV